MLISAEDLRFRSKRNFRLAAVFGVVYDADARCAPSSRQSAVQAPHTTKLAPPAPQRARARELVLRPQTSARTGVSYDRVYALERAADMCTQRCLQCVAQMCGQANTKLLMPSGAQQNYRAPLR